MSFKDCVNTKDCEKMKTDIDDVKDSISGITETTIPDIQDDISDLDDRVTTLENTPTGIGVFHRITSGESVSNKDRVIYFKISVDYSFTSVPEDNIYSVFIPSGVDVASGNYPISILTYYGFNKDSTTNVYGMSIINSIYLFGIGETSVNVTKKYITSSGSGSSQSDSYTIANVIPKNLRNKQCCIYERE